MTTDGQNTYKKHQSRQLLHTTIKLIANDQRHKTSTPYKNTTTTQHQLKTGILQ